MRKRVLLAEQSDAVRGVAETVLRQNGFEVVSVAAAEKALEVLKFSRPDLLIIGGELTTIDQRPLYDRIQSDPKTASIALLLFGDASDSSLPFPSEVIIPRPFDPNEFLEKVRIFSGTIESDKQAAPNPLEAASLDDDFLDAALGLDRIDVTDSEVMDKTTKIKTKAPPHSLDKFIGLDHAENGQEKQTESGKVESVMIREGTGTDGDPRNQQKKPKPSLSASGKLDILPDQYGLSDPNALQVDTGNQVHDYEWFVNEMRKEAEASQISSPPPDIDTTDKAESPELTISDPASMVTPLPTPSDARESAPTQPKAPVVEKFIDEFKKEIEKVHSDEPESIMLKADKPAEEKAGVRDKKWEESFEDITSEQVGLFTHQLCSELAEKIADKIVSKIDSEKLLNLIKNEIFSRTRNKP